MQSLVKKIFNDLNGQAFPHLFDYLHYLTVNDQKSLFKLAYPHAKWNQSLSWREKYVFSL